MQRKETLRGVVMALTIIMIGMMTMTTTIDVLVVGERSSFTTYITVLMLLSVLEQLDDDDAVVTPDLGVYGGRRFDRRSITIPRLSAGSLR